MAKEMVSALNIRKSFGGQPVLKGISCSVHQGEVLAIIGEHRIFMFIVFIYC